MTAALAALLVALALLVVVPNRPARAEYQTIPAGLDQWSWVRAPQGVPMSAAVVRADGWLIVATAERFQGDGLIGGGLLLVPPWGGAPTPFGDPPDRITGNHSYTKLVLRGDRLFGLTSMLDSRSRIGQKARLVELDARTGAVLASHGSWWFPDLTVDPRSGDLVLWDYRCSGQCTEDDYDGTNLGRVTHRLVRYNPDTHKGVVLLPDAMTDNIGGSGTCQSRRQSLHTCEEVFRVAFSPDGGTIFLATSRLESNAIDVRDRNGTLRFSVPVPRPVDAMRFGVAKTCLEDTLVLTAYDGTAWVIPNALVDTGDAARARLAAAGAPIGASAAALTNDGNVLTLRRSEGVLLACPPFTPPLPPGPPVGPLAAAAAAPPAQPAPVSTGGPAPGPPTPASPAPPAANVPPPVQPPGLPAVAGPASHAGQAASSVQVGLADAEQEQPVYSLSASRRSPDALAWGSLAVGVAAAVGFASVAFVTIPMRRRNDLPRIAVAATRQRSTR